MRRVNKKGEVIVVVIIFLVIISCVSVTYFYFREGGNGGKKNNVPIANSTSGEVLNQSDNATENEPLVNVNSPVSNDSFSLAGRIHWSHMPLTYMINNKEECAGTPVKKIEEAFGIIKEFTSGRVSFVEVFSGDEDIEINCVDADALLAEINESIKCSTETFDYDKIRIDPAREGLIDKGDFLLNVTSVSKNITENFTEVVYEICYLDGGDSSISDELNLLQEDEPVVSENVIEHHSISIYKMGQGKGFCSNIPTREIHEIFHSFGFGHSEEPSYDAYYGWPDLDIPYLADVMFPTLYCQYQKKIDEKYISCLNKIYSNNETEGSCENVNSLE
ncbi:MAG: hypothetical protein ABIG28_02360 [archaeon]